MESSESSLSIWQDTAPPIRFVPLREDLDADVCVIGAGIAGMSVAYELARKGRRVVVVDDGPVGGGETGHTTAHLASALDDRFATLEEVHGRDGARLAYESHRAAIERIAQIAVGEGIDCDLAQLDGYLFLAPGDSAELLDDELAAAHRAGFTGVQRLDRAPTVWSTGPCLRFPGQARFHPLRYLEGLARCIHRDGGHIFTGSHVVEVEEGAEARVRTEGGAVVTAGAVVVATNSPINDRVAIHTKQEPYRTYVIGARLGGDPVPDALYWDTGDPYHYVRFQPLAGGEWLLIVGGEDHRTGQEPGDGDPHARLEEWTRGRFPIGAVEYRWSGQVMEPVDYLGFIGRNPGTADNVFVVTGDSGQGMTHGVIAGMLVSDLVLGVDNPWASLYDPSRVSLRLDTVKEFVRAGLQTAGHYAEHLTGAPGEVESVEEIAPGSGAVLGKGPSPIAVYRDPSGTAHRLTAVCSHLGCIVHWNDLEKSWDCPCHGSRYDAHGRVLNGPATAGLKRVED